MSGRVPDHVSNVCFNRSLRPAYGAGESGGERVRVNFGLRERGKLPRVPGVAAQRDAVASASGAACVACVACVVS